MRFFEAVLLGIYLCVVLELANAAMSLNATTRPFLPTSYSSAFTTISSSKPNPTKEISCNGITNTSCEDCAGNSQCFWCASTTKCMKFERSIKLIPEGCKNNDWYWKQCFINGHVLMILVPSLVGGFLLFLTCSIYCCCCRSSCRKRRDRKEEDGYHHRREEIRMRSEERKTQRQTRYDLIRKKYGLLENQDEDDDEPMEDPRVARVI